jgi:general secretion pathway protein F
MPAYAFEALARARPEGVVEADTARRRRVAAQPRPGPLEVRAVPPPPTSGGFASAPVQRAVLSPGGDLDPAAGRLVSSGLTLERAPTALSDEADTEQQHHLVAALRAEVNAGSSFAKRWGVSARVQRHLRRRGRRRRQAATWATCWSGWPTTWKAAGAQRRLLAATLYPAIVTVAAIAIVLLLMTYACPVANVYGGSGRCPC